MIKWGLIWSFASVAVMAVVSIYAWGILPNDGQFAVHWSANGEVNRYAGKFEALLGLPLLAVGLAALFAVLPQIAPRRKNLEQSSGLYISGWIGGMAILACAHAFIVFTALSDGAPQLGWIMIPVSMLLIVMGNFMTKSRSNWFAGIKTPWTLSSEHSWAVTHRFGGYGFVLIGIASLIAVPFADLKMIMFALCAAVLLIAATSVVVSIFAWKNDPDRRPIATSD